MKLVYTHSNLAMLVQVHSLIELAGIECVVRMERSTLFPIPVGSTTDSI
jgi:hypothetical protein